MTTMTTPMPLSTAGGLEGYLRMARQAPIIGEREERDLAKRLRERGDLNAARRLVIGHLRLVIAVARGYNGYGLSQADLIQEGNVGLMRAVKRFDPARGARLATFAVHWIKAEMHEYILRNWRMVKIATTKAQRKLFFNLRRMLMKSESRALTPADARRIAAELGVKAEEVAEMHRRFQSPEVPFDAPAGGGGDDDDRVYPADYLAADGDAEGALVEHSEAAERKGALTAALAGLDRRSRAILQARRLADDDGGKSTLQRLAAEYGVSAERVRQIEKQALAKVTAAVRARLAA